MDNPFGILIFGANGSGKTTLGREVARLLSYKHIDHEEYAFRESDVPFTDERSKEECIELMLTDIVRYKSFVLSAVIGDFGDRISKYYKFAVYIDVPFEIRMERVRKRDYTRFGNRVLKGGDMYEQSRRFYDFIESRSFLEVEEYMGTLTCPVLQVDGRKNIKVNAINIISNWSAFSLPKIYMSSDIP